MCNIQRNTDCHHWFPTKVPCTVCNMCRSLCLPHWDEWSSSPRGRTWMRTSLATPTPYQPLWPHPLLLVTPTPYLQEPEQKCFSGLCSALLHPSQTALFFLCLGSELVKSPYRSLLCSPFICLLGPAPLKHHFLFHSLSCLWRWNHPCYNWRCGALLCTGLCCLTLPLYF